MNDLFLDKLFLKLNGKDTIDYNDRFKVYQIMKYRKLGTLQLYHLGLNMNLVPNLFENSKFENPLISIYYKMCTEMDITEMNMFKYMKTSIYPKLVCQCIHSLDNDKEHLMMLIHNTLYILRIMYDKDIFDKIDIHDMIIDDEAVKTLVHILTCLDDEEFIDIGNDLWNKLFKKSIYYTEFKEALPHNRYIKKNILMNTNSLIYKIVDRIVNR